ncbi:MAG TPA: endonuclease domain-containing protein [Rhizomicrobium sp.]|jgi:very-short-patch-repair endonuclease
MRLHPSDAERYMWNALRGKRLGGLRFRRQHPIGPYIVDFYCASAKLIIEMDGGRHALDENAVRDKTRTRWLEEQGYKIVRFWNSDFLREPAYVIENILSVLNHMNVPALKNRSEH